MFAASKTASVSGGYQISRSLRFNSADSSYLIRTPSTASNRKTWTWSAWVKRSKLGTRQQIFNARPGPSEVIEFYTNDVISMFDYTGGVVYQLNTTQVFRDVSAWYHIVWMKDTTQATDTNRMKLYINGVQVTSFSTANYPAQNSESYINNNVNHHLGTTETTDLFLDGYMTEVNFIDGQALTPSSFGETNAQTGVWQPKAYSGSYGTNGFYLNFSDNSNTTAATLGKDYSGNGNNWTPNNFSVTAGAGNDSLVDSPTSYGTDTGVGGTVRGNYATLNPLLGSTATLSNGNLNMVVGTTATKVLATIGMSSGKWYWEYSYTDISGDGICGIATSQASITAHVGLDAYSWGYVAGTGNKVTNSSSSAYGASYTTGDVIGVAFDADAGTLVFYKNGTSQGTAYSSLTSGPYFPAFGDNAAGASSTLWANFGQRPFAYTAPSGYKALCTQNLPTPTIGATTATQAGKYYNAVTYTGNGSSRSITGLGFQPDFTWIKARSVAYSHRLADAVRGAGKELYSDDTAAETTNSANGYVTSFDSDGFSLGTGIGVNANTQTFVAWNWKANGAGSTNTAGSITSTVSANTTSGFSIVTFTTQSSGTATIGHGLGSAPSMIIAKPRALGESWYTYHSVLGAGNFITLNGTGASTASTTMWNNTSPTSTVFSMGTNWANVGTMVAYCFSEVAGFSKFGSYVGNGSADGPFVYTGMRPAYFLTRNITDGGNWNLYDATRGPYNLDTPMIIPNSSASEYSGGIDLLSNGIKIRTDDSPAGSNVNQSGKTYIFAAFASNPFKYSLAR